MSDSVTIRMYNVGLGDSFLLTFPGDGKSDRARKVLIDCGVHPCGPGPRPIGDVVKQIVKDVTENGEPRIDVVIVTHRHRDHVSGFESALWSKVRVDEVWLPWTEDPNDPKARAILEKQAKSAKKLHAALRATAVDPGVLAIAENSLTNAKAMSTLHHGFKGTGIRRRYLPSKNDGERLVECDSLPGVTVHVMGPSRDPDVIRDMNPPSGESYLRLAGSSGGGSIANPFAGVWTVSETGATFPDWYEANLKRDARLTVPRPGEWSHDDSRLLDEWLLSLGMTARDFSMVDGRATVDALALVVALDAAVNGTSLMLMFEIGRAFLLFPGDAQWGTWQGAIADPEWKSHLEKTTFYKVGHHGSHNATPKEFVTDLVPSPFSAMVCTKATKKFKEIPRAPLLAALKKKSKNHIVRSDKPASVKGFRRLGDVYSETDIPI